MNASISYAFYSQRSREKWIKARRKEDRESKNRIKKVLLSAGFYLFCHRYEMETREQDRKPAMIIITYWCLPGLSVYRFSFSCQGNESKGFPRFFCYDKKRWLSSFPGRSVGMITKISSAIDRSYFKGVASKEREHCTVIQDTLKMGHEYSTVPRTQEQVSERENEWAQRSARAKGTSRVLKRDRFFFRLPKDEISLNRKGRKSTKNEIQR